MRTPVAVLGTLAEFHRRPIPFDLPALVRLVTSLEPDFLCLDLTMDQWHGRDATELPPEYRDALLPLACQTDMVVVPVAGDRPPPAPSASGWRGRLLEALRRRLERVQSSAPDPGGVNQGWRHVLANVLYELIDGLAGRDIYRAWREHALHLTQAVRDVARRDPGRRILVVVNVRHCHRIRKALEDSVGLRVVRYTDLARRHGWTEGVR